MHQYGRSCYKCQIMNLQKPHFIDLYQDIPQTPHDHISIDLLGPYNATSPGHSYTMTAVCNLTGYFLTTLIKDKKTTMVANHLFLNIMLNFGFSRISHSNNGTEFKSKLIENLSQQLGIKILLFPLATHKLIENWNLLIDLSKTVVINFL